MAYPQVSIIIPLYNKAPYIKKALESVCAQSFTDWECIIMDDGSTDDSATIAAQWISQQEETIRKRFRLLHQANAGVAAARNNAVEASTGDKIAFLDADDWWGPAFLQEMLIFSNQYPDAGIWGCNYIYYKPGKTRIGVTNVAYITPDAAWINYPKSYFQGTGMPIWTGSILISRSIFKALGGFPEDIRLGEDFLLWARVALQYPISFMDKPLAYYNNASTLSPRATQQLHAPEHHMLFRMDAIEEASRQLPKPLCKDWKLLMDKLRIYGLMDYWLDERYHDVAKAELKKVDWSLQPSSQKRLYMQPIGWLRFRRQLMAWGSHLKQWLYRATDRFRGEQN